MPNVTGIPGPGDFRENAPLSATQLNRIVTQLLRRITGGNGIRVRSFSDGQIIVESAKDKENLVHTMRVSVQALVEDSDYPYTYRCYKVGADGGVLYTTNSSGVETPQYIEVRNIYNTEPETGTLTIAHRINGIWWMQVGEESIVVPTIDFFVDNFDRDDTDNLGDNWLNGERFAIRNQVAYADGTGTHGGSTISFGYTGGYTNYDHTNGHTRNDWQDTVLTEDEVTSVEPEEAFYEVQGITTSSVSSTGALYAAAMRTANYNVRVSVNVAQYGDNLSGYVGVLLNVPYTNTERGTCLLVSVAKADTIVVPAVSCSASATTTYSGTHINSGASRTATASASSSSSHESFTLPGFDCALCQKGNMAGTSVLDVMVFGSLEGEDDSDRDDTGWIYDYAYAPSPYEDDYIWAGALTSTYVYWDSGILPESDRLDLSLTTGSNDVLFEVREGKVSCKVNGNLLFASEDLYTLDAGLVGLMSAYADLGSYVEGSADWHIASIKAWTTDTPEPSSSESGHGTYDSETGYTYTDKYHTGDTYDPNA